MSKDKIYALLVAVNQIPSKEIKDDMRLIVEIAGKIGTQADKSTALMRSINIEFVETALDRILTNATSSSLQEGELALIVNFLVKVQDTFNHNLKNYHEHDATLKSRIGKLGSQLENTVDNLKAKGGANQALFSKNSTKNHIFKTNRHTTKRKGASSNDTTAEGAPPPSTKKKKAL